MELNSWVSNVTYSSVLPWKKSNLVSSKERIKATTQSLHYILRSSPVQDLASLVCVPSSSPLLGGSTWTWAVRLLKAIWQASSGHGASMCKGAGVKQTTELCLSINQELNQLTLQDFMLL